MSLLLDARKKVELALEQSGVHRAIEPQLSETLRLEDLPAGGRDARDPHHATPQRAAPARSTPEGAPPLRGDPRAAGQNLFAAKTSLTGGMRLGIIPIAIISGLVLAAGGGYYVWREISPPPVMQRHNPAPSPKQIEAQVSGGSVNSAQPRAEVEAPVPVAKDDRPANAAPPAALPVAAPAAPVIQTASVPATAASATSVPLTSAAEATPAVPAKKAPAKNESVQKGAGMKQGKHASKVVAPSAPPNTPPSTEAQPIRIEHGQEGDAVDPILLAAYQAYRNGDFDTALQRYSEVLRKDAQNRNTPNRDALLGMAAIAQQQSQDAIAARYYNQVLTLDPRDPIANAGMSALLGTSDVANTESRLKLLLAQQLHSAGTQSSALHFALGNLYAEQSRWGDAQQAYFNACNLEQGNAQFAFNLAVSLDHLGQGKLAAQHYQRALQLDLSDNPGFNRAQTQQRINELTAP